MRMMCSTFTLDNAKSSVNDGCVTNASENFTDNYITTTPYSVTPTDIYQSYENVTDSDEIAIDESSVLLFVVLIFKWILSLLAMTANGLTITVVAKYIKKMTPTHVVIVFLSFSGFLIGIIVHPLNVVLYFTGNSLNFKHLCDFLTWVKFVGVSLNFCGVFLIAIERCFLVTSPKLYKKFLTVKKQVYLCIAFSICILVFATIYILLVDSELRFGDCYPTLKISQLKASLRPILYITIMTPFSVATCSIAFCYLRICHFVWKHGRALASNQNSSIQNHFQKEKRTTVTIVIILTVYFLGKGSAFFYSLLTINNVINWNIELFEFLALLWHTAAVVDISIYAWKVPEFRQGYRKIVCCLGRSSIIQVAPIASVQPRGINLPLEPRRQFESAGCAMNLPSGSLESGPCATRTTSLSAKATQATK